MTFSTISKGNLLLLCYYDVISIHNLLSTINQALPNSLSKINQVFEWIVAGMFKYGTLGCAGWSGSPEFLCCGDYTGVFPTIFV